MTHLEHFPLPATARHDENGNHIPPHICEWERAADPTNPYAYDPNRVPRGSEVERDQRQKTVFEAHLDAHRHLGEPARVLDED